MGQHVVALITVNHSPAPSCTTVLASGTVSRRPAPLQLLLACDWIRRSAEITTGELAVSSISAPTSAGVSSFLDISFTPFFAARRSHKCTKFRSHIVLNHPHENEGIAVGDQKNRASTFSTFFEEEKKGKIKTEQTALKVMTSRTISQHAPRFAVVFAPRELSPAFVQRSCSDPEASAGEDQPTPGADSGLKRKGSFDIPSSKAFLTSSKSVPINPESKQCSIMLERQLVVPCTSGCPSSPQTHASSPFQGRDRLRFVPLLSEQLAFYPSCTWGDTKTPLAPKSS